MIPFSSCTKVEPLASHEFVYKNETPYHITIERYFWGVLEDKKDKIHPFESITHVLIIDNIDETFLHSDSVRIVFNSDRELWFRGHYWDKEPKSIFAADNRETTQIGEYKYRHVYTFTDLHYEMASEIAD
jgi:hypothetical protein